MSASTVALLLALAPYVVPPLAAALVYLVNRALAALPANQHQLVVQAVQSGVSAAEQMATAQLNGPGKKQLATELIEKLLASWHISVPASVISTLIEQTVAQINASQPAVPVVPVAPVAAPVPTPANAG